mmetsp:Transcript_1204/g.2663  ORF Transcript_1204/g.2663 Transcript_1204/m.2663 type:complete len:314 (-) Transcript_1204:791-1732(-)
MATRTKSISTPTPSPLLSAAPPRERPCARWGGTSPWFLWHWIWTRELATQRLRSRALLTYGLASGLEQPPWPICRIQSSWTAAPGPFLSGNSATTTLALRCRPPSLWCRTRSAPSPPPSPLSCATTGVLPAASPTPPTTRTVPPTATVTAIASPGPSTLSAFPLRITLQTRFAICELQTWTLAESTGASLTRAGTTACGAAPKCLGASFALSCSSAHSPGPRPSTSLLTQGPRASPSLPQRAPRPRCRTTASPAAVERSCLSRPAPPSASAAATRRAAPSTASPGPTTACPTPPQQSRATRTRVAISRRTAVA